MAQNDPIFAAGDDVMVWASPSQAAEVMAGQNAAAPRPALVVGFHPSEPETLEVRYQDGAEPASELIGEGDRLRLRHVADAARAAEVARLRAELASAQEAHSAHVAALQRQMEQL